MTQNYAQQKNVRISCIICAYNEAPRIAAVLAVTSIHPLLNEVIVVDDGSTDQTAEIVRQFPTVKLISLPVNQGKSIAMATGVMAAQNELLMLLDADLTGLAAEHVNALAFPVLSDKADVSLSLRKNSLLIFRAIGLDFVSGERVIRKDLLSEVLEEMHGLPRFGIEVFMNRQIIARQYSIAVTHWLSVAQSRKTEKLGYWKGIRAEWRMLSDLFQMEYPLALISQTYQLLLLRINRPATVAFAVWISKLRDSVL
ncbi:MAG TPA: glycosyltransferase family 2 protein [Gallionella sp.]|nr:glycosyltransferase family 2 protein [Gallionella sp.]